METGRKPEKPYNPTEGIWMSFGDYVSGMKEQDQKRRTGGIPNYAFALDYQLREQIRKIPHFYSISRRLMEQQSARMRQIYANAAIRVSGGQFPEIYGMAVDCAKRLGIGVPNLYVYPDQTMNAFAIASDTVAPTIVLNSGIVERLTPGELKCAIGHECGHIHNEHVVYTMIYSAVAEAVAASPLGFLSMANQLLLLEWQRAAEITCDRAALICCDDPQDAVNINQKLATGGLLNQETNLDIEAVREQFRDLSAVAAAIVESGSTHPSTIRRILATLEFMECEILYEWRPDLRKPGTILRSREETDARCEKYTTLIKEKKGGRKK